MMSEDTHSYIKYLNCLHNYNAQNSNAYGEKNVESPFYAKTMVGMDICNHIIEALTESDPNILVLTGHAGDGKTSLMYQVLNSLRIRPEFDKSRIDITLPNGKTCCCIKDFSEYSDDQKLETLKDIATYPSQGRHVFMVANTGPFINTFGRLFDDENDCEKAKMQLIEAMDGNRGDITDIYGYPFMIINVAAIDNTGFPKKYLHRIVDNEYWADCATCEKKPYCHIHRNKQLISDNVDRVVDFLTMYYIWETEYGHRLTIRSMTEQLAYMITGGKECEDIAPRDTHKWLFFNLFFGYIGTLPNPQAQNILAVRLASENNFDRRRLRSDDELIIRHNYKKLFSTDVCEMIEQAEKDCRYIPGWTEELRRMYFFLNIVPSDVWGHDIEDIFSKQYSAYLKVRNGGKTSRDQRTLVVDALRMIYQGSVISNSNTIPITLSKESGIAQSVQLVVGELNTNDIELKAEQESKMSANKYNVVLCLPMNKRVTLTIPMINYFEELRNGVISTNIDPQLSHGIENLKALLLKITYSNDDDLEMIVLNNSGYKKLTISIDDEMLRLNN